MLSSHITNLQKSFDLANKSGIKRVHPTETKVEAVYVDVDEIILVEKGLAEIDADMSTEII